MYFLDDNLKPISRRLNNLNPTTLNRPATEIPETYRSVHHLLKRQNEYCVTLEKDPHRPVGKLYKSGCVDK